MKIDRRISNGLIWAGAAIVLGVPAVDLLSAQFAGEATPQVATAMPQAQTAEAAPAPVAAPAPAAPREAPKEAPKPTPAPAPVAQPAAPAASANGVVDSYLQSGRELPSYISDAPASTAAPAPTPALTTPVQPAPAAPAPSQPEPTEMAALPPAKVAPVPMPLSMRPRPVEAPLVVETPVAVNRPAVVPPPMGEVTAADLADWETGPLSEFLAQRARERGGAASDYDPNGFYLDQGPNSRQRQRSWVVGPADDVYFAD